MTSTCCCSTRPAPSRSATGRPPPSTRCRASASRSWPRPRSSPRWPTRPRRAVPSSCSPRGIGIRERELAGHEAEFVPFTAQTRMSGVDVDGHRLRKGAGDAVERWIRDEGGTIPPQLRDELDRIGREGGTPLAVARDSQVLGVVVPQGRHQGRHARAVRPAARHGHPHGHGHRRQPAHRREDRRGVGRRRLPRRGDPGAQARADRRAAGAGPARRDDRRRHERRARARAGRRRRGDEHRHPGRPRGGEHGRPRQQPDEAHRDRRGRQAAAHHARRPDDVLDRQRRREVLRDPAGDLRGHLRRGGRDDGSAGRAEHHGPGHAAVGDHQRDRLQRDRHPAARAARAARACATSPSGATALLRRNLLLYGLGGVVAPFVGIKLIDLVVHNVLGA